MAQSDQSLNPAQAAAAVATFLGMEGELNATAPSLEVLGNPSLVAHPDLGPLASFRSQFGVFWVSPRGNVVYYAGTALKAPVPQPQPSRYAAIAQSFAERHVRDFRERNFHAEANKFDRTTGAFRWTEKVRSGVESAIFPNWVEVVLQIPQARVIRFSASDLTLVRKQPPALNESQARARIRARFAKASIEDIDLILLPRDGGSSSIAVWTALVMSMAAEGPVTSRVTIDADTGQEIQD